MTSIHTVRRRLAHISTPALLSDLKGDEFEGYASLFGVPDGAGDVVAPGAFRASLRKRPPAEVRMLYQHSAQEPLGVWETIREDAKGLYVKGRLVLDVTRARDVKSLIGEGALNGLSIGFRTVRAARDAKSGFRTLLEIELWEISVVTFPLLAGSKVTAIGAKGLAHNLRQAALRINPQLSSPASLRGAKAREGDPGPNTGMVSAPGFPSPRARRALGRE